MFRRGEYAGAVVVDEGVFVDREGSRLVIGWEDVDLGEGK